MRTSDRVFFNKKLSHTHDLHDKQGVAGSGRTLAGPAGEGERSRGAAWCVLDLFCVVLVGVVDKVRSIVLSLTRCVCT